MIMGMLFAFVAGLLAGWALASVRSKSRSAVASKDNDAPGRPHGGYRLRGRQLHRPLIHGEATLQLITPMGHLWLVRGSVGVWRDADTGESVRDYKLLGYLNDLWVKAKWDEAQGKAPSRIIAEGQVWPLIEGGDPHITNLKEAFQALRGAYEPRIEE
jgi:hypothetical protein